MERSEDCELQRENCYASLTYKSLDVRAVMDKVRSPKAGAIVTFAGITRDNFNNKPVRQLSYTSYTPKALRTLLDIADFVHSKYNLISVALVHRLGLVPVGEESVLIAAASPHRKAAFEACEEALEECKARTEIWKFEEFEGEDGGMWKANRDGPAVGMKVETGGCLTER